VEGVLITPARRATAHLERLGQRGIPFVMLDSPSIDGESCSVAVDDVRGAELAIELLLARGHEHVAFLNGPTRIRQCADRRRGVLRALRQAGLERSALTEVTLRSQTPQEGDIAAARLLAASPRPTAVFCINDLVALGVLRRMRLEGLSVPSDMAVVGYDDIEVATIVLPELTSVRQPKNELGRVAAELLFSEIDDGEHRHRQVLFEPELVVRESA
jgi:LacI family transcriptional regulator